MDWHHQALALAFDDFGAHSVFKQATVRAGSGPASARVGPGPISADAARAVRARATSPGAVGPARASAVGPARASGTSSAVTALHTPKNTLAASHIQTSNFQARQRRALRQKRPRTHLGVCAWVDSHQANQGHQHQRDNNCR